VQVAVGEGRVDHQDAAQAQREQDDDRAQRPLLGMAPQQQQAAEQHEVAEGVRGAHELAEQGLTPLQDGGAEHEIPTENDHSRHHHHAVEQDAQAHGARERAARQQQ